MKKTDKQAQEQVRQLLELNTPPDIEMAAKKALVTQLDQDIQTYAYCNPQPFWGKILAQASYLSLWIWVIQAGLLAVFFCLAFRGDKRLLATDILFLAPCLILILLWELSKTFSHNMWEMESACRYNLAQLFFFRLCILSGSDFLVLGGALAAFRMAGGLLWQFALNVLLPFFLSASLCLWALRRFGNRVNRAGLAGACMMLFVMWIPLQSELITVWATYGDTALPTSPSYLTWLPDAIYWFTLIALALFLISAFRLCTRQYFETNRKDRSIWNLE